MDFKKLVLLMFCHWNLPWIASANWESSMTVVVTCASYLRCLMPLQCSSQKSQLQWQVYSALEPGSPRTLELLSAYPWIVCDLEQLQNPSFSVALFDIWNLVSNSKYHNLFSFHFPLLSTIYQPDWYEIEVMSCVQKLFWNDEGKFNMHLIL